MTKLEKTKELIASGAKNFPKGMICWSGGKDSMVLLHIMRGMGIELPLVFFREPWQPSKYKFHDKSLFMPFCFLSLLKILILLSDKE